MENNLLNQTKKMNKEDNKTFIFIILVIIAWFLLLVGTWGKEITIGFSTKTKMSKNKIPEINISLKEVTIKSECKTCKSTPLERKEWYEGHWGCVECGDPNKKNKDE